tara:strand:+ start:11726 stop:12151 length:426 start_codon:yes stop_codon:yes gene_type:complete
MTEAIKNFKEKHKNKDKIDHVIDFLKDQYSHKKSINFSYDQALIKANKWTEELNRRNKDLKDSGEVELIHTFENGYKLVKLIDQTSRDWEGLKMSHCVSSYKDEDILYSLRKDSGKPFCTMEVDGEGKLVQISGKANGDMK